jgi:hypothetical protein
MRHVTFVLALAVALTLPTLRPTAAQDGADVVRANEQGVAAAIRNKDRRALGTFLAAKFTWWTPPAPPGRSRT